MDLYECNPDRANYIDILKGLLIITVVLGHATDSAIMVFWFHMPLFFIISGYLYKEPNDLFKWIIKKTKRYLIPYISYFIFTSIFISRNMSIENVVKFFYGGRMIAGVWWFTTCLLLSLIILTVIVKRISKKASVVIILICYMIGILESNFFISQDTISFPLGFKLPWNVDVCLVSLLYLSFGYFSKEYITKIQSQPRRKKMLCLLISIIIIIILMLVNYLNIYNFKLDMKYSYYTNPVLVSIVPICFGYILLIFSLYLNRTPLKKILSLLGRDSMAIMYLHVGILTIFKSSFGFEDYKCFIYAIVAIVISCIFSELVSKNKVTKKIFVTGDF